MAAIGKKYFTLPQLRDLKIIYTFNCDTVENGMKRSYSVIIKEEYAAKDFLTFVYCGGNSRHRSGVQSQLQQKGLLVEFNMPNIVCTVAEQLLSDLDFRTHVDNIRKCVLNLQEHLSFREFKLTDFNDLGDSVIKNLLSSNATKNQSLFIQIHVGADQENQTFEHLLWLVYDQSCQDEVARYTDYGVSVCDTQDIIKHVEPMKPNDSYCLLKLGLLQAAQDYFHYPLDMQVTENGLQVSVQRQIYKTSTGNFSSFLDKFMSSVKHSEEPIHIKYLDVLKLPEVDTAIQAALTDLPVNVETDLQNAKFRFCSTNAELVLRSFHIIKEKLVETVLPVTPKCKFMLGQENWKTFVESVKGTASFNFEQNGSFMVVTGLRETVEKVLIHVNNPIHAGAAQDVEMLDVSLQTSDATEEVPVQDTNVFYYLKKFYAIGLEFSEQSEFQHIILKGQKTDVKKKKQIIQDTIQKICTETMDFEDSGYFSSTEGSRFLENLQDDHQILIQVQNYHKQKLQLAKKNADLLPGWTEVNSKNICKWEHFMNCAITLALAKTDDIRADIVIEIVAGKQIKGGETSFNFVSKVRHEKVSLSLPHFHPSHNLADADKKVKEIFEKVGRSGLKTIAVSVDSIASWTLEAFIPLMLRSFTSFLQDTSFRKSGHAITLILCSTVDDNVDKARKICNRKLTQVFESQESSAKKSEAHIDIEVVEGKLHETKADVLVNLISTDLNLSRGIVSKSLLDCAGKEMQKELFVKYGKKLPADGIAETCGYKLECQYVIHGDLPEVEEALSEARQSYEQNINEFVKSCLKKATKLNCKTIAFPAIGTGRLCYPVDIVASEMFWAVDEFATENPKNTLEKVLLILYPSDKEVHQVFRDQKKKYLDKLAEEDRKSSLTLRLVGPRENVSSAKETISDKLKRLKKNEPVRREIHGVSDKSYQLLKFFHKDRLELWEKKGFSFDCSDAVLTIDGYTGDIDIVKTGLEHCLSVNRELCREHLPYQGIDCDLVEQTLKQRNTNDVCCILDSKNEEILFFGECVDSVTREKTLVSALFQTQLVDKSSKRIPVMGKTKTQEGLGLKASQSIIPLQVGRPGSGKDGKDSDAVMQNGQSNADGIRENIKNIPYEYFLIMKQMNPELFKKFNMEKFADLQKVCLDSNSVCEFDKLLNEVREVQTQNIALPTTFKSIKAILEENADCIYNECTSTITVFGEDMNLVQGKVHQLKLRLGLLQKHDRAGRQLTESREIPKSPDPGDRMERNYHGGARHKDHAVQGWTETPHSSDSEMYQTNENILVYVYTRSILDLNVDCIVNAANETLDHGGGIAKVISKAAGSELQKDCEKHIKKVGKLKTGEVWVSKPGMLRYKYVIHAVGPRWNSYNPRMSDDVNRCKRDLFVAVLNSFLAAEEKGMKTIAVPAISSATFKVPMSYCTEMYAAAVLAYSKQSQVSSSRLKKIHFVDKKPEVIKLIQNEFRSMIPNGKIPDFLSNEKITGKLSSSTSPDSSTTTQKPRQDDQKLAYPFPYCKLNSEYGFGQELHCNFSRSLLLIVGTGSVFDKEKIVDAAVCSENIGGRGPGYVSKKLLEKGGFGYISAKTTAFKKQPKFGNVVTCKGGYTGFKKVLHTVMWPKDDKIKEEKKRDRFKRMFKAVFKTAVAEKCESIAMPLLFTGQGKVNPEFCTDMFLQACFQLSKEEKQAKLTVYLLNTEPWKTDLIVDKIKEFVNFQSALRISKADRLPPPPRSSYPPKKTGRSTQANGNQHVRGGRKPASGMYRSQTELMSNRNRYDKTVHRMSSSFTSMSVRSTQSVFYVDVSDDSRKTQELTKEPNDSDDDSYNSGEDGSDDNQDENCVICMDTVSQPKQLKCGHKFCTDCIDSYFSSYKKVCPTCGAVCGIVTGDQPLGTMDVAYDRNFSCVGYEGMGTIIIRYSFESGKQGPEHPDPGRPYKGITRTAYLPDNKEGRKVCEMLRVAFARRLVFTIGSSRTTGQEGVITWNDIHHKTNLKPHGQFGYPDPGYLDRVKDELAVKGVTPDDIPMLSHTK